MTVAYIIQKEAYSILSYIISCFPTSKEVIELINTKYVSNGISFKGTLDEDNKTSFMPACVQYSVSFKKKLTITFTSNTNTKENYKISYEELDSILRIFLRKYVAIEDKILAIKEALAAHNIQSIVDPNFIVTDEAIDRYLSQHGESLKEPAAYTVNYALVKNAKRVSMLYYGWHFARGAQLGYNFTKSEPLPKTYISDLGQTKNESGRPIDGRQFNFVYVRTMQEDDESPSQIGPFTSFDDVLFSCPQTISILENAEIGAPISRDLACSGQWHAFVIPAWKREEMKMDDEKARQIAIENIRGAHNEAYRAKMLGDN